jgi:hypothetical protein
MGIFDHLNPPARTWLPRWVWQKQDARFLSALLQTKGADDAVLHPYIQRVLFIERWKRAIEPYLRIFRLAKEVTFGRYWKPATQVYGGTNQTSGGGGTGSYATVSIKSGAITSITLSNPGSFTSTTLSNPGSFTCAAPPTFEDAGIRAGEVTAYRCWELRDGLLWSMYRDQFCWKPGEIVEGEPSVYGEGIHAFKDRLAVGAYGYSPSQSSVVVSGTVELWGEVYEHERGYRASKAAIASIDDSPYYDAKVLRKTYGLIKRSRIKRKKKPSRLPKGG